MAIYLPSEMETEVFGDRGMVCIMQTKEVGEIVEIWLTVRQFQEIWNHEKHIVAESLGVEK